MCDVSQLYLEIRFNLKKNESEEFMVFIMRNNQKKRKQKTLEILEILFYLFNQSKKRKETKKKVVKKYKDEIIKY